MPPKPEQEAREKIDAQLVAADWVIHNIGVTATRTIALKGIDSDYFEEY